MKRFLALALIAVGIMSIAVGCKKADPSIELNTPASITVDSGNSATITFTANNNWTVVPS